MTAKKRRAPGRRPRTLSKRATAQTAARKRREANAALSENAFQALAGGWSVRQIAEVRKVSARTIQREIERAVAKRRLDAPDRFIHLQLARLTKALRVTDVRLDHGELAAVAPLLKVVAALERYHRSIDPRDPVHAPLAHLALPAPPLALTHAAARSGATEDATDATTRDATVFGA